MRKKISKIKRLGSLALIFLFSINSFAAIVSDSDGSTFVTKAEFDAMKNSFKKQIDVYNESIDGKIDGAIASYLAGIKISKAPEDLYEKLKTNINGDVWFRNKVDDIGQSTVSTELRVNAERHYSYKVYNNYESYWGISFRSGEPQVSTGYDVFFKHNLQTIGSDGSAGGAMFVSEAHWDFGSATSWNERSTSDLPAFSWKGNRTSYLGTANKNETKKANTTVDGSGKGWIFHRTPAGKLILREYAKNYWPLLIVDLQYHTYKTFNSLGTSGANFKAYYMSDNGLADTRTFNQTLSALSNYGSSTSGTRRNDDDFSNDNSVYYSQTLTQIKASDFVDYSIAQWGKNSDTTLYCFEDNQSLESATERSASIPTQYFYSTYTTKDGDYLQTNSLGGGTLKYTPKTLTPSTHKLSEFVNEYITSVAGEDVKLGGGVPLCQSNDDEQTIKMIITFKCKNSAGASVNDTVHFKISDTQFKDGDWGSATAIHFADETFDTATSGPVTVTCNCDRRNEICWLNAYADTAGNQVAIDTLDLK